MTEAEWLACTDLSKMLAFLSGRASNRKLRLSAAACCHEALRLVGAGGGLPSVAVAEDLADGTATYAEIASATSAVEVLLYEAEQDRAAALENYHAEAGPSWYCCPYCEAQSPTTWADVNPTADAEFAYRAMEAVVASEAVGLAAEAAVQVLGTNAVVWREAIESARSALRLVGKHSDEQLRGVLHDVFGNPVRPPTLDPAWLGWDGGTISKMARAIYDARTFDRLPILADALEEAGCTEADILEHCRSGSQHVRGCWVVDLLLGKE